MSTMKNKTFRAAVDQYAYWDGSPLEGRAAELQKPDPAQAAKKREQKTYTPPATDAPTQPTQPGAGNEESDALEEFFREIARDRAMGINKATGEPRKASTKPKPAPIQLSPKQDMEEYLAELEADEAEARWEQIPEHPSNLEDDALHEAQTATFSDAVTAKTKEIQQQRNEKPTAQIPPIEPEAWDPGTESVNPANYAQELHAKGEQLGEDDQLATAGVYEGSPQQLQQFAKMLGLEMWGVITTPQQLHGAIEYAGPAARARLMDILQRNGLAITEPQTRSASERVGGAVSDFVTGFKQTSPIGLARTAMRSVGRGLAGPIGEAVASNLTRRDRNQAVDKYEPGYEPMQVNAIPPPKAKPKPSPRAFTARTNDPNADFWITRRGSMETVGRPHKEFAPESIGITVNEEHLDPTYAYYMMQHLHGQGHWKQHATGTTNLVNIRTKHLKQLADQLTPEPEPLPPVQGPIPPLPKEKQAEQSYGEKEVARIQETTKDPEQFAAFNESDHPRADDGKFTTKQQAAAGDAQLTGLQLKPGDEITTTRKMTFANPGYTQSVKEVKRKIETVEPGKNPDKLKVQFAGSKTKYIYKKSTGVLTALNDQMTEHRVANVNASGNTEKQQPGIVMPSDDVSNEDASQGDQLGLFGEGKKKKVPKKYKQDNPQGKARAKSLFDKDEDPDQQTLFSSWGEAVEYYSMQKKK